MSFDLPPIVKLAERVMLELEQCVRTFPRYHKYAVGADLRRHAFSVTELAHLAWRDRARQQQRTMDLIRAIDRLKLCMQLAQRLQAFRSFAQFESVFRNIIDLGKQCGGWQRHQHQKGQNERASEATAQRAQILSARGASSEVNP